MEDLSKYTQIELLKMINETNVQHESLRQEIIVDSYEFDKIEKMINKKIEHLNNLEKNYIELIEEMNNRNAI